LLNQGWERNGEFCLTVAPLTGVLEQTTVFNGKGWVALLPKFWFNPVSSVTQLELAFGDRGFNPSRCTVECDLRQVIHTHCLCHSAMWYRRKLQSKQAHRVTHWPHVHGLAELAKELQLSTARWSKLLEKDFTTY